MEDLDREIFEANQDAYQENLRLTSSQKDEVQAIVRQQLDSGLSEIREQQKTQSDYFRAKSDPSKPNFDEMCNLGVQVVKDNKNLMASLNGAENKPEFLYEIGIREAAYQATKNHAPQPQPKQILPEPQQASSPFVGRPDPSQIHWKGLTEDQFIKYAMEMGAKFD